MKYCVTISVCRTDERTVEYETLEEAQSAYRAAIDEAELKQRADAIKLTVTRDTTAPGL